MRALIAGSIALLLAFSASAETFQDMAKRVEDSGLDIVGTIIKLEKQKGRPLTEDEMREVRRRHDEALRNQNLRDQQENSDRDARQLRLVAVAPRLMTDALQRQCFDYLASAMNDPSSLKIGAALAIDRDGSLGDIPEGQVQFTSRIWGRNPYGATVGAALSCRYAVNGDTMTFQGIAIYPSRTGILAGR